MYFIVGLGNPGKEYENTRHNLGFEVVDALARKLEIDFSSGSKLKGEIAKKDNLILLKPSTFMNLSGESVRKTIAFYDKSLAGKKELRTLYVIHDDLDLAFGQTKMVFGSGPKGHNGVNSVREQLGTDQFWYGRLGVDARAPENRMEPQDYVLSRFGAQELPTVDAMLATIVDKLYALVS